MKKEKVNIEELNEAITTGNKILKLSYFVMVIALIGGIIFLLRTLNLDEKFSLVFSRPFS